MPTLTVVFQVSTKKSLPELGLVYHPSYRHNRNVIQNIANGCGEVGKVAGDQGAVGKSAVGKNSQVSRGQGGCG